MEVSIDNCAWLQSKHTLLGRKTVSEAERAGSRRQARSEAESRTAFSTPGKTTVGFPQEEHAATGRAALTMVAVAKELYFYVEAPIGKGVRRK